MFVKTTRRISNPIWVSCIRLERLFNYVEYLVTLHCRRGMVPTYLAERIA